MSKRSKCPKMFSPESHVIEDNDPPDMINKYGTYNIQPTADTNNTYPAIAQGKPKLPPENNIREYP